MRYLRTFDHIHTFTVDEPDHHPPALNKIMKAQYNAVSVLKVEVASPSEAMVPVYKLPYVASHPPRQ
jgi:hypothetical protein